eukprot:m.267875 g.267875  ORF g.267875 m.267875 type:complete len:245 (-) comp34703_c0_seq1:49-783(-)
MLRRKLDALQYPHADTFSSENEGAVRNLVVWLEDTKIRFYKIEERADLRQVDGAEWNAAFLKFLKDLECPRPFSDFSSDQFTRISVLDWLLSHAVLLEYSDDAEQFNATNVQETAPTELPPIEPTSAEFKAGLAQVAKLVKIPAHDDQLVLRAVASLVQNKLSQQAVSSALALKNEKPKSQPLSKTSLGFDAKDPALNEAGKILRLLHIQDLRQLQTQVNEVIALAQSLTANPKTNAKLGQVGR